MNEHNETYPLHYEGCAYHLLDDEAHVRTMLANATVMANAELLDITSHKFSPFGVTAVALLAESHISIHTWARETHGSM